MKTEVVNAKKVKTENNAEKARGNREKMWMAGFSRCLSDIGLGNTQELVFSHLQNLVLFVRKIFQ